MKELTAAIYSHFITGSNDLKTALSSQLYPHEAAESATFPYGVYYFVTSDNDLFFSDEHELPIIQFTLFSEADGSDEVQTAAGYLEALFDNAALSVSGWSTIKFQRSNKQLLRDKERKTWAYHIDYMVTLERER